MRYMGQLRLPTHRTSGGAVLFPLLNPVLLAFSIRFEELVTLLHVSNPAFDKEHTSALL